MQVGIGKDGATSLPFEAEFFDVRSDFVQVSIYSDTTKLDAALRPWLELYKDIGMSSIACQGQSDAGSSQPFSNASMGHHHVCFLARSI